MLVPFRNQNIFAVWLMAILLAGVLFAFSSEAAESAPIQIIIPAGSQSSTKGPAETFTGEARVDVHFLPTANLPILGATLSFEPGARTFWHTHPYEQYILVTSGVGLVGTWDGPVEEIRAGDVVWCPANVKHWHGAAPHTGMSHIVVVGTVDGINHEWMEEVTDAQYHSAIPR